MISKDVVFLKEKTNKMGKYFSGKGGENGPIIFASDNKDGSVKITIGKELFTAKPTKSGKGHIFSIGEKQYFVSKGESQYGPYCRLALLPPLEKDTDDEEDTPPSKTETKYYGKNSKFKS